MRRGVILFSSDSVSCLADMGAQGGLSSTGDAF